MFDCLLQGFADNRPNWLDGKIHWGYWNGARAMNIWDMDKLILFLLFFVPGFISLKVYDLCIAGDRRDFAKAWFDAVAYSAINYGFCSWLLFLMQYHNWAATFPGGYFFSIFFILFVMPILWPIVFIWLMKCKMLRNYFIHPIATPWDYVFNQRKRHWVIAHLKDGWQIGGWYGDNSYTSAYPIDKQIYLEKVWTLDRRGNFIKEVEQTEGIILFGEDLTALELFKWGDDSDERNFEKPNT